jgi:hypothetical protein
LEKISWVRPTTQYSRAALWTAQRWKEVARPWPTSPTFFLVRPTAHTPCATAQPRQRPKLPPDYCAHGLTAPHAYTPPPLPYPLQESCVEVKSPLCSPLRAPHRHSMCTERRHREPPSQASPSCRPCAHASPPSRGSVFEPPSAARRPRSTTAPSIPFVVSSSQ